MKECLQDKLFIGFLIFVGVVTFLVGTANRLEEEKKQNEIVERG